MRYLLNNKRILITGGTGSLGKALLTGIISGQYGNPAEITLFSRDEAKQFELRNRLLRDCRIADDLESTDCSQKRAGKVRFIIGDIRDFNALQRAVHGQNIIFHAAAMKHVPIAEYNPWEAVQTNLTGTENLIRAATAPDSIVTKVIGISTDKACNPVNVMGMTKALQEKMLIEANLRGRAAFACVRYGNVVASRGSAVPLFKEQIQAGNPVTLTSGDMTRFLITLERAVEAVMNVLAKASPGEIWVPHLSSVRMKDLVTVMIKEIKTPYCNSSVIREIGIRPGEKIHELLVSQEEAPRTYSNDDYFIIRPSFPELNNNADSSMASDNRTEFLQGPVSSDQHIAQEEEIIKILRSAGIIK